MSDTFEIPDTIPAPEPVTIADPEPASVDPEAPYGRFANGKPRKAPPTKKSAAPKAVPAPKANAPRAPKAKATDYRPVVEKGLGLLSMALIGLSKGGRNRAFLADAATVQMHAAQGARVVNDLAQINPALARALQTSAPAVPYLELGTFLFGLGAQLAANHGVRLPVPGVEVEDPEQLAMGMEQQIGAAATAVRAQEERDRQEAEWARQEAPNIERLIKEGRRGGPFDSPADHAPVPEHGFAAV